MVNRNDSQPHEPLEALSIKTKLQNALATENPIDSLRQYVLELLQFGYSKEAIYQAFLAYHMLLQEQDRCLEADVLGDVMDMITGWYVGWELELK